MTPPVASADINHSTRATMPAANPSAQSWGKIGGGTMVPLGSVWALILVMITATVWIQASLAGLRSDIKDLQSAWVAEDMAAWTRDLERANHPTVTVPDPMRVWRERRSK